MTDNLGLYIHIPFCLSKCSYCDFYSVTSDRLCSGYVDALLLHMEDYSHGTGARATDSVFIGGGTPTALPKSSLLDIIGATYHYFNITPDAEYTIEANPATVDCAELRQYRRAGVNRLSIGMQSACDNELAALSRIHTYDDFEASYRAARRAKFDNINIDIMYGIPEQTESSLRMTLDTVCDLDPEHISLYGLKIEENTPFARVKDKLRLPDEETEFRMYSSAVELLESHGYRQYEISNFAKPGRECRHNLKYWNCEEYLGLGAAAHSYYGGKRFAFRRDIEAYITALERPESGVSLISESYEIKPEERVGEYIMLRLRLCDGINTDDFTARFGADFEQMYSRQLALYLKHGFMKKTDHNYAFTLKGMFVSNYILSGMLSFDSVIAEGIADGSDK